MATCGTALAIDRPRCELVDDRAHNDEVGAQLVGGANVVELRRRTVKGTGRVLGLAAAFSLMTANANPALAYSVDFLAANISPAATFQGASGNFTVTNAVAGGSAITFDLTYSVGGSAGSTTFPKTVTFGASTTVKPEGATDAAVSGLIPTCTFASAASTCVSQVTITAPATPGGYQVQIRTTGGTGGSGGISGGNVNVNFTVAQPEENVGTSLALVLSRSCTLYRGTSSIDFTATLTATSDGSPIAGQTITFKVDGAAAGSATTGANGQATVAFDPSGLSIGDHTVYAEFAAAGGYEGSNDSKTLGVTYLFVGYQPPINADGSSLFGGTVVPVKIRITDALGASIPDASAHVFFALGTPVPVGTDAEPLASTSPDGGNTMRYDIKADQYVFNWDVSGKVNGTYSVRVDLGEETCGAEHIVTLSLSKRGKGKQ